MKSRLLSKKKIPKNLNIKKIFVIFLIAVIGLISIQSVLAHCPLCTAAAGAGIGVARWLGVDDSIVGLFLGAFIVSMGLWFNNWLKKKKISLPFQGFLLVFASFLLTIIPLYLTGIIRSFEIVKSLPEISMLGLGIFGIDKLLFGAIVGTFVVFASFSLSDYIKKRNGKILFPYQGISFMIIILLIFSEVFWIITK